MDLSRRRGWQLAHSDRSTVFVASSARARLLGLALLDDLPGGVALLLPGCRSVHTIGMRFALDLAFLDARGRPLRIDRAVGPGRLRSCRRARFVLETRAGHADPLVEHLPVLLDRHAQPVCPS